MAWCRQAPSHYLNQCWPIPPYGVTMPQWVLKTITNRKEMITNIQYSRCKFAQVHRLWCGCGNNTAWWRHQMETFSAILAICAGIHRSPVNSPHKGQWRGALMFSLICSWINDWENNRDAGDLRRHHAHYDVIVINDVVIILHRPKHFHKIWIMSA